MRRTLDVIVVFIFLISVFSIFFLKEGVTGNDITAREVVEIENLPEYRVTEKILYPNAVYDVRFCRTMDTGVEVGVVNKKTRTQRVERYVFDDVYELDKQQRTIYTCEPGMVMQTTIRELYA